MKEQINENMIAGKQASIQILPNSRVRAGLMVGSFEEAHVVSREFVCDILSNRS